MINLPSLSIIIPVYNASDFLAQCLDSLTKALPDNTEVIVVDDASQDNSTQIAANYPVQLLRLESNQGPAAARNFGAGQARGEVLCFIDADILIPHDGLFQLALRFASKPDLAALFGSYDNTPYATNLVSQYRNLLHHYTHQQGQLTASTFWAGYGAIRRDIFESIGGFDQQAYTRRGMEDIELGYRLCNAGYTIYLIPELQCTHLKHWSLSSMIRTDIINRAIPWSRLILDHKQMPEDLNTRWSQRVSVALTLLVSALFPLLFYFPEFMFIEVALLSVILLLNRALFSFFVQSRGWWFTIAAFALQLLFFFYSGLTFLSVFMACHLGYYKNKDISNAA